MIEDLSTPLLIQSLSQSGVADEPVRVSSQWATDTTYNHINTYLGGDTMNRVLNSFLSAIALLAVSTPAFAQQTEASGTFSLQGRLTTGASNEAVADGEQTLNIKVYVAGTNNVVITENDVVTTVDGIFSTMIGDDATLSLDAETEYEIGVSVNGGAELAPRIEIGDAPSAIVADVAATADVALNANAVGGFTVGVGGQTGANNIVTTDANGQIDADLLGANLVTSINGETGAVNLNVTGSGVSVDSDGNGNINLTITGGGGGSFELPFTGTTNVVSGTDAAFRLTSTGAGSAATFLNTGTGSALTLNSQNAAAAALTINNTAGGAINATSDAVGGATLTLQNSANGASANLISGLNASSANVFNVAADGSTRIQTTGTTALNAITSASNGAALRLQNTATGANALLVNAVDASGSTVFEIDANGTTTIDAAAGEALNLTSGGSATLMLTNTANGSLLSGGDGSLNTAFDVLANGQTTINSSAANALTVTSSATTGAVVRLQNTAQGSTTQLINGLNAQGNTVFEVLKNGRTVITSNATNALDVTSNAAAGVALRATGGISFPQAAGTGTLTAGLTSMVVNNPTVTANSIVLLTVNSATNLTNSVRVSAVGNGTFTVSLLDTALGALAGNLTFNYLVINTQ